MTDIITSICGELADVGLEIVGINASGVYDPPPANLQTGNLPALFVWTGTAAHDEDGLGESLVETTRRFYVQVAVMPTGQGDPNTREALIRPLIEATLAAYRKHPKLYGLNWVERVRVGADSGVIILPEYGGKFIGFEISLDVVYFTPRTYASGE